MELDYEDDETIQQQTEPDDAIEMVGDDPDDAGARCSISRTARLLTTAPALKL